MFFCHVLGVGHWNTLHSKHVKLHSIISLQMFLGPSLRVWDTGLTAAQSHTHSLLARVLDKLHVQWGAHLATGSHEVSGITQTVEELKQATQQQQRKCPHRKLRLNQHWILAQKYKTWEKNLFAYYFCVGLGIGVKLVDINLLCLEGERENIVLTPNGVKTTRLIICSLQMWSASAEDPWIVT